MPRQSLSDRLARRIRELIQQGEYRQGDRLPAIMEMARSFGVGHPTVREALKKLEAVGVVEIRHGSGVYVSRSDDVMLLATPDYAPVVTQKLLADLIRSRMPLEMQSVAEAVPHLTARHIKEMRRLLSEAEKHLDDDGVLNRVNMQFHRQIAVASENAVLLQLLDVLREMFQHEQLMILDIFGSRRADHQGHQAILDALERRDEALAVSRMRMHLQAVLDAVLQWDPERHPVH
ncbi:MAG TPA: GntR family transcriptional regulator [Gemmatimonadales bacterium]|nr:GntR family transcriptional regulator [Gemmatimonadales bacterium]